eukprot:CAMPEP_0113933688 /NCGR_PEP_ID=MMETSP1339-20121228/1014_1 /TAXON_ID=94617 /ORGANISM="Fibrocapsa japonica" /LENGTH=433 /DNA_ID=CAMNT_0000935123 /DNA_START=297 /DNA_END=1598 /DNA_ORIENTATION=- /assembly_acc=CAM_ASM_000762
MNDDMPAITNEISKSDMSFQYPSSRVERVPDSEWLIRGILTVGLAKELLLWCGFSCLVAYMRSFYGVIAGTFILSYIGRNVVNWLHRKVNTALHRISESRLLPMKELPRKFFALAWIVSILTAITTITITLVPAVKLQSPMVMRAMQSEGVYRVLTDILVNMLGEDGVSRLEAFLVSISTSAPPAAVIESSGKSVKVAKLLQYQLTPYYNTAYTFFKQTLSTLTGALSKGVISLLFSFLIIYDLPRLTKGAEMVKKAPRLKWAYNVIVPRLTNFARLVGKSFEVQFLIALANTFLTTMGLVLLGIPGAWLFSIIVFICSFIPLLGILISTLPMTAVAISEYGLVKVFEVIGMVVFVHIVEAYLLNPQIYASKLKLHPVLVLAALYVTEHMAGVKALFLAIPVTVYVINELLADNNQLAGSDGNGPASESSYNS